MRARPLVLLLLLFSVATPENSFPQAAVAGKVHLGAVYVDTREGMDMKVGGSIIHAITSKISLEWTVDWVNLDGLSSPEDRFDYDALYYDGAATYKMSRQSTDLLFGAGIGAATFLLHDVTTTDQSADTKPMISLIAGIEWHSGDSSSTRFRFEMRDNVVLGNKDGLVKETRSTTHSVGLTAGVLFDL